MTTLADYMHSLGLSWFLKDPDDIGNASYADAMFSLADGVLTEQCNQYDTCQYLSEYEHTKAILNAEYSISLSSFCSADDTAGINGVLFPVDLNGPRQPCQ